MGDHLVSPRRVSRSRGAPPRLHGSGQHSLALRRRRSQLRRAKAAGGEGSWAGAHARSAYLPHHERRHAGVPAHSGAAAAARQTFHEASGHGSARSRRDDGRRHSPGRRRDADRSRGERQDDLCDAVRRGWSSPGRVLRRGGVRGVSRGVPGARENGVRGFRREDRCRQALGHLPASAGSLRGRDARRDSRRGATHRRHARGDRFVVRLRDRARADLPRGF